MIKMIYYVFTCILYPVLILVCGGFSWNKRGEFEGGLVSLLPRRGKGRTPLLDGEPNIGYLLSLSISRRTLP
jgi:hypothetical protein